jgi:hypothetical protein
LEKVKECRGILNKTNESSISEQIAEMAAQHVTTHDIILLYGECDHHLQLLKEIKSVDCSILYIESSVACKFKRKCFLINRYPR